MACGVTQRCQCGFEPLLPDFGGWIAQQGEASQFARCGGILIEVDPLRRLQRFTQRRALAQLLEEHVTQSREYTDIGQRGGAQYCRPSVGLEQEGVGHRVLFGVDEIGVPATPLRDQQRRRIAQSARFSGREQDAAAGVQAPDGVAGMTHVADQRAALVQLSLQRGLGGGQT